MTTGIQLPAHLSERAVYLTDGSPTAGGEFVLYWAHHALRAHENPALEAAADIALQLGLPLLVYQGLGGRHRYNSDRHHRFILESARDFASQLESIGLKLVFHLPKQPNESGPLGKLITRSAAVVSEIYPVPPFPSWYQQHASRHPDRLWLMVDSSCNLPMPARHGCQTRAFQFRQKNMAELQERIRRQWPAPEQWPVAFNGDPGFEAFDLSESLSGAIAACAIDHSVPAVAETPGGSAAANARWQEFLKNGMAHYGRLRNDAALPHAVSRLSPYLHYGCISPFQVAREADASGCDGAEKFLDELLTWRELNHHFCFHSEELESLAALPDWARTTLREHELDPRQELYDWERLIRGETSEPLWNLAQRSLLRRGELHNNLRMTWGKAILPWTARAGRALKLLIDLNHRFALDGNDPNSYGGLLWCMGQFDRAFPPGPVFGKVRQRSISRHASRLDVNQYARWVSRPANGRKLSVAVVGAGLAGLTAARLLEDHGHDVVVVEKARGPGGRMSTRRKDDARFDHGAQYFTARDPRFLRHVLAWQERGLVEEWSARIAVIEDQGIRASESQERRFLPVPAMNSICSEMAGTLTSLHYRWQLESARREGQEWILTNSDGDTLRADTLVMTAPPPQSQQLLAEYLAELDTPLPEMLPCWALMLQSEKPLFDHFDAAFINQGPLSWLAAQASRPGRPGLQCWTVHASPEWSQANLERSAEEATGEMLRALAELPGILSVQPVDAVAHRWRYALANEPLDSGCIWLEQQALALAGDWCHGSRVEGAFLSGTAAAGRIMGSRAARNENAPNRN